MLPVDKNYEPKQDQNLGVRKDKFSDFRALYGMKLSEATWRAKLVETLNYIGYSSTDTDPDVWINRPTIDNGTDYY